MTTTIRDFDPTAGCAFQGDVAIVPVPAGIKIARTEEVAPVAGRLILQEGEVTGHHHAIHLLALNNIPRFRDDGLARDLAIAADVPVGTARMFRDAAAVQAMVAARILTRADLCVGFLVVDGAPMVVNHEEHDGIRLPVGSYYIGRQVESAGAEERRVAD